MRDPLSFWIFVAIMVGGCGHPPRFPGRCACPNITMGTSHVFTMVTSHVFNMGTSHVFTMGTSHVFGSTVYTQVQKFGTFPCAAAVVYTFSAFSFLSRVVLADRRDVISSPVSVCSRRAIPPPYGSHGALSGSSSLANCRSRPFGARHCPRPMSASGLCGSEHRRRCTAFWAPRVPCATAAS